MTPVIALALFSQAMTPVIALALFSQAMTPVIALALFSTSAVSCTTMHVYILYGVHSILLIQ